jgi:hypothetical protein
MNQAKAEVFRKCYASKAAEVLGVPLKEVLVRFEHEPGGISVVLFVEGAPASEDQRMRVETAMREILRQATPAS